MKEVPDLSKSLPPPARLYRSIIVSFVLGEQALHFLCVACCVRRAPNPDTGDEIDWLHCKGCQTGLYRYGDPPGPKPALNVLIPVSHVMRIVHYHRYQVIGEAKQGHLGYFPPIDPAPDAALSLGEIKGIIEKLQVKPGVKAPFLYDDYVRSVSTRFEQALDRIKTVHNFELGDEFEIAICKTLRAVLPQKYGICRGYVVSSLGETAGDDVVIYDRMRFPTLRGLDTDDFSSKEHIPSEAVYAYIEAKHSISLEGDGGNSLQKALAQVSNVKILCDRRQGVPFSPAISDFERQRSAEARPGWPDINNPAYGVIICRHVRFKEGGPVIQDPAEIDRRLLSASAKTILPPDFCVFGKDNMYIPVMYQEDSDSTWMPSPFFIPEKSGVHSSVVDGVAFGAGLSILFWALDWIQLGEMPWPDILEDCIPPKIHSK
jgi:hypothetical protein